MDTFQSYNKISSYLLVSKIHLLEYLLTVVHPVYMILVLGVRSLILLIGMRTFNYFRQGLEFQSPH